MEIVELLLNQGACLNAGECENCTPLHRAAQGGIEEIVKLLLKHGACVNSAYTYIYWEGYTPLHAAVERRHEKVVQLLLECGANDVPCENGKTVLHSAVGTGCSVIIEYVLKYSPEVNNFDSKNKDGRTPLHIAAEEGHIEVVEVLSLILKMKMVEWQFTLLLTNGVNRLL